MVIQDNFSVFKYEYVSSLLYQFGLLHKSLPTLCSECKDNFHSLTLIKTHIFYSHIFDQHTQMYLQCSHSYSLTTLTILCLTAAIQDMSYHSAYSLQAFETHKIPLHMPLLHMSLHIYCGKL